MSVRWDVYEREKILTAPWSRVREWKLMNVGTSVGLWRLSRELGDGRRWKGVVGWDHNFIDACEFISSVMMGVEYPCGIRTPKEEERAYVIPWALSSAEFRAEDYQLIWGDTKFLDFGIWMGLAHSFSHLQPDASTVEPRRVWHRACPPLLAFR